MRRFAPTEPGGQRGVACQAPDRPAGAAVGRSQDAPDQEAGSWSDVLNRYPTKKIFNQLAEEFKVSGPAVELEDPQCMPRLPVAVLRHHREEPVREVPPFTEIAWSMQSLLTNPATMGAPCTEAGQWAILQVHQVPEGPSPTGP